ALEGDRFRFGVFVADAGHDIDRAAHKFGVDIHLGVDGPDIFIDVVVLGAVHRSRYAKGGIKRRGISAISDQGRARSARVKVAKLANHAEFLHQVPGGGGDITHRGNAPVTQRVIRADGALVHARRTEG